MKRIALLVLLALVTSLVAHQATDTGLADPNAEPAIDRHEVTRGTTVQQLPLPRYDLLSVDPGQTPEGDFTGGVAFTNDGERVVLTNRISNNVTVFDCDTMQPLANIDVGDYPQDVAITDDYAVVPCIFSNEVWVIDLEDYSVAGVFTTDEQPAIVEVSPSGQYAYVGCDINDVLEVIDLSSLTQLDSIDNFFMSLWGFWGAPATGRGGYMFTNFEVLNDNTTIAFGDWETEVRFVDALTGTTTAATAATGIRKVHISGDRTQLVAVSESTLHRIDTTSHAVTASVSFGDATIGANYDAGVTQDGAKAFVGISGNQSAIARFDTQDYTSFSSTYSAFFVGMNSDRTIAISGQYRLSLIDMENEVMLGQHQGVQKDVGAVSPVNNRIVSYYNSYEGLTWFEFTDAGSITYRGRSLSGAAPEGDTPFRMALSPDESTALVTGSIGTSVSVVDMATGAVEEIIELEVEPRDVGITPDGAWAVVSAFSYMSPYSDGLAYIIDMSNYSVAAEIDTGQRPFSVVMGPDDNRAYVANIQGNSITVIDVNGASSTVAANIPCGTIGVLYTHYSTYSGVTISPDGDWLLVCASFDDQLKIIDTNSLQVVATLPTDDFPMKAAFTGDGDYALVTNAFDNTITFVEMDGAGSSVVGTLNPGDKPLRCATNPVTGDVGVVVCDNAVVKEYSIPDGAVVNTWSFSQYDSHCYDLVYDAAGQPIVISDEYIHYGDNHIPITGAADIVWSDANAVGLACVPSPDELLHISFGEFGSITGSVELEGVTTYEGVTVEITELGRTLVTGEDGAFEFNLVPSGEYTIEINKEDWTPYEGEVTVQAGENVDLGLIALTMIQKHIVEIDANYSDEGVTLQFTIEGNELSSFLPASIYILLDGEQNTPDVWTLLDEINSPDPSIYEGTISSPTVFAAHHIDSSFDVVFSNVLNPQSSGDTPATPATALSQNTPNPFNPSTTVRFSLAQAGRTRIEVFDIRGRRVTTLADEHFEAGEHNLVWDAASQPSGVYLLRMRAGGQEMTRRMLLLK